MAWQLHYTSARSGPTGRSGFQFVAETPGLPPGVRAAVTPFMAYRPPPDAPLSPNPQELERFPVALAYEPVGGRALLVRSRYLGQDYSGRYGNFFAHAVVAEREELEGLRPIELWQAEIWAERPGEGELAALEDLPPGAGVSPETLAGRMAGDGSHRLLVRLVDAAVAALERGHGRLVLVCEDAEPIVRWIAVLSYSLPAAATARLSFTTFSADPAGAPHRVVGTTPGVWSAAHHDDPAFFVGPDSGEDSTGSEDDGEGGRFARTVAACWRDRDFAGLDALGELAAVQFADGAGDGGLRGADGLPLARVLDRAAALLALCRGEEGVAPQEEAAAAELLTRHGARVPEWVWTELVPALPGVGFDLALAMHTWARRTKAADVADRCAARCVILALEDPALAARLPECELPDEALARLTPLVVRALERAAGLTEVGRLLALASRIGAVLPAEDVRSAAAGCARRGAGDLPEAMAAAPAQWRERLADGVVAGLAQVDPRERAGLLTDRACDLLQARDWTQEPGVGLTVLASVGRRHRDRRVDVTGALLRLSGPDAGEVDAVLREVWAVPAAAQECGALLDAYEELVPRYPALAALPSRTFRQAALDGDTALEDPVLLRVAGQVLAAFPEGERAERDASVLIAYAKTVGAVKAEAAAAGLDAVHAAAGRATAELCEAVFAGAARRLARRDPGFRAAVLAGVSASVRTRLAGRWMEPRGRGLWGRSGFGAAQRNELVEVALRLRLAGASEPRLEAWARAAAGRWRAARQLETYLRDEPGLREELRRLVSDAPAGRREG
ncbi:hypothetical protein SAMN04489712_10323 [Thermomonospora echinospora]|uniref:Uncharacterized protein n=1 Tax=Thermomonospora echinospora TaxID=1992 RepID=A0A1H5WZY8_9ACTN|nr:hypothetical protein [Thermomonospora echinospora]SEG04795.1 hypothetical protein SAMN04489712_10323 [Thermomonospora echinospora]